MYPAVRVQRFVPLMPCFSTEKLKMLMMKLLEELDHFQISTKGATFAVMEPEGYDNARYEFLTQMLGVCSFRVKEEC